MEGSQSGQSHQLVRIAPTSAADWPGRELSPGLFQRILPLHHPAFEFSSNANIIFVVAVNKAQSQAGPGLADTATIERKLAPGGDQPGS
jgi:hypothetical protein